MSQERIILVAKRRNERSNCSNFGNWNKGAENDPGKKAIKRSLKGQTNLAQDRLKRLRQKLNDEITASEIASPKTNSSEKLTPVPSRSTANVLKQDFLTEDFSMTSDVEMLDCSDVSYTVTEPSSQFQLTENRVTENRVTENSTPKNLNQIAKMTPSHSTTTCNIPDFVPNDEKKLYIVTDTNIFISHIHLMKEVIGMKKGQIDPVIFVPWIVNEELDFIKDDPRRSNIKTQARQAIKFIAGVLSSKNSRFQMQTIWDVNDQKYVGDSQDNKIITCCFQVQQKHQNMVLLTNDANLRNKAIIHNIPTCQGSDLFTKVLKKPQLAKTQQILTKPRTIKTQKIMEKMVSLCNHIIRVCAEKSYGSVCSSMDICKPKAKSLEDCVLRFKRYWFPVFQERIIKQCKNALDALLTFISTNRQVTDDTSEMKELIIQCVRFCAYLKEVEGCQDLVKNTIDDLKGYSEQCKNF